ncbi:MAG: hypothetical protein K6G19_09435 [Lachnospiraceae bacterium]|nr:hypothetical protein [Lachnospiraceae bacterium]
MSETISESSRPVPKALNERMGDQFGRNIRWRKMWDSEKDRIAEYFHAEYFRGSLILVLLLFLSFIGTVSLVVSTVSCVSERDFGQIVRNTVILVVLYALLILLSKLLIHQPKRELNAVNMDIALVCETEIVSKYLLKQTSIKDYIKSYRLRYRADVMMPYDVDDSGTQTGKFPVRPVGMSGSVYSKVKNGDRVLVVFFPDDSDESPDMEKMEIFMHEKSV